MWFLEERKTLSFIFICDILSNDFFSVWIFFLLYLMLWGVFGVCLHGVARYVRNLLVSGM